VALNRAADRDAARENTTTRGSVLARNARLLREARPLDSEVLIPFRLYFAGLRRGLGVYGYASGGEPQEGE
jgi:hypothetical protein